MKQKTTLFTLFLAAACITLILPISCNKETALQTRLSTSAADDATTANGSLIAWYPFNGDTKDHSKNGNDVIFNNATPTTGKNGQANTAYYFDGSTYMQVADDSTLNPKHAVTLYAVIKPMGFYQGECHGNRVISKGYNDFADGRLDLGYDDAPSYQYQGCDLPVRERYESSYGTFGNGSLATGARDTTEYIKANKWYVLAYTYDGTISKLYINGVLKDSSTITSAFKPNGDPLFIGRNQDPGFPYNFKGVIDEIRIYRTALNIFQIQQLMKAPQSN